MIPQPLNNCSLHLSFLLLSLRTTKSPRWPKTQMSLKWYLIIFHFYTPSSIYHWFSWFSSLCLLHLSFHVQFSHWTDIYWVFTDIWDILQINEYLQIFTTCPSERLAKLQWIQWNFCLCSFLKVLCSSLIFHSFLEPSLHLLDFVLFFKLDADDLQSPYFSPPYLFSWILQPTSNAMHSEPNSEATEIPSVFPR